MTINKRKKRSRQRGSRSHGWGTKKKHRGSGSRGGVGMAGTGKRAGQKRSLILKIYGPEYFGKKGFKRPQYSAKEIKTINIRQLEAKIDYLVAKGLAKKAGNVFEVDITKIGYDKLLSTGKLTRKFNITTKAVSHKAIEKIQNSGGSIKVIGSQE